MIAKLDSPNRTHMAPLWVTHCGTSHRLLAVAEECSGWRIFGENTIYDSRWVRLGLVDVGSPNGERWDGGGITTWCI